MISVTVALSFLIIKKSKMISQVKPGPDLPSTIRPVPAKAAASRPFSAEIMPDISRRHKMVPALSPTAYRQQGPAFIFSKADFHKLPLASQDTLITQAKAITARTLTAVKG